MLEATVSRSERARGKTGASMLIFAGMGTDAVDALAGGLFDDTEAAGPDTFLGVGGTAL